MHLVRVGRRVISLEHLIMQEHAPAERGQPPIPPGGSRVVLESGIVFDLPPEETDLLRRQVDLVIQPDPPPLTGTVGRAIDPQTGRSLSATGTEPRRRRKSGQ